MKMDNLRIWDHVRTDAEIAANWNKDIATNESGLMGLYNFNEGTGLYSLNKSTGVDYIGSYLYLGDGAGFSSDVPR